MGDRLKALLQPYLKGVDPNPDEPERQLTQRRQDAKKRLCDFAALRENSWLAKQELAGKILKRLLNKKPN